MENNQISHLHIHINPNQNQTNADSKRSYWMNQVFRLTGRVVPDDKSVKRGTKGDK